MGTNELQQTYLRAGHAHAGALVILGLVVRLRFLIHLGAAALVTALASAGVALIMAGVRTA